MSASTLASRAPTWITIRHSLKSWSQTAADIELAIESFARAPNGGLFLPPNATIISHRDLIIALAARHRLPAVYAFRQFVAAGGLVFYGIDQVDVWRKAALYVDRAVPPGVLVAADEVIE